MTRPRVCEYIVIGGGFAGLHCAYRLADAGFQVTVLESRPAPMQCASKHNFARLHHGWHYPGSVATGRQAIASSFDFAEEFTDLLLPGPPGWCTLVAGSMTGVEQWLGQAEQLRQHYLDILRYRGGGFGDPARFFRPMADREWRRFLAPEHILLAATTLEPFVDLNALTQRVVTRAETHPRIRILSNHHIDLVCPTDNGYLLTTRAQRSTFHAQFVLNASWLSRHRLDSMITPQPAVAYRLKTYLRVRLPDELNQLPSQLFVHGPYCTFTNLTDGTGLVDHAPVSNSSGRRTALWSQLAPSRCDRLAKGILDGASKLIPLMSKAEVISGHTGALFHQDKVGDDRDPASAIHHRLGTGVRAVAPRWLSLDTGKLSWVPHHARQVVSQSLQALTGPTR